MIKKDNIVSSPKGRIKIIDALRGISLIGICLIHAMQHFGVAGTNAHQTFFTWEGTSDDISGWIISNLVAGKFYIIFSCLFGLSFFIQMDRASQGGIDFRPRFLWRLVLLLLFGYTLGLIFRIEILLIYALVGFVLVLMYKWSTKLLIGIVVFLFLGGVPLISLGIKTWTTPTKVEQADVHTISTSAQTALTQRESPRPRVRTSPTLSETIRYNAWDGLARKMNYQFSSGRIYLTLGLFILGFIIGRIRLFERLSEFRQRLLRMAGGALLLIALLSFAEIYIPAVARGEVSIYSWLGTTAGNIKNLCIAYLWSILIMEAYRSTHIQRLSEPFVNYGRMGLTNYAVQSILGVFIFAGFGLNWSHLGITLSVLVGITYTTLQILFSHYWLRTFRYGPFEWLWRSGTYMKWQPLKR